MVSLKGLLFIYMLFAFGAGVAQLTLEELSIITRSNPDSAINALPFFFKDVKDSVRGTALNVMGNAYYFKSNYDSAISYYKKSATIFEGIRDEKNTVKNYNNLGVCYYFLGNYPKAYLFHHKAMEIRERLNDPKITSTYNNLGLVLEALESDEKALEYYKKSLNKKIELKQNSSISTTLNNIGNIFSGLQEFDSAISYELKNIAHLDTIPDQRDLSRSYNNLGLRYYLTQNFEKAEFFSLKSFMMKKAIGDHFGLINSGNNLSKIYQSKKQYRKARLYLDSIFLLVPNVKELPNGLDTYLLRSKIDSVEGDYLSAYHNLITYNVLADSIEAQDQSKLLLDLENKYQAEKKDAEIEELAAQNLIQTLQAEQERQTRLILIIAAIALIIIVGLLFFRFKAKTRTNLILDAKNQELVSLNRTKDRLFSIISHDLKSPLSSFHTITSSLTSNWDQLEKEQLKEFIESLRDSSANVRDMMDNLLKWALTQTNQLSYNPTKVHPLQVIEEVLLQVQASATLKEITFQTDVMSTAAINTDKQFLEIIIRNLLSNALKFSKMNSEISILVEEQEQMLCIQIRDEGIGMNQSQLEQLLAGEIVAHDIQNSTEKGTGLGLTLCNELMTKMGATMRVSSEECAGTTFQLIFQKAA